MIDTAFPAGSPDVAEPHLAGLTDQGQPTGQTTDATNWNPSEALTAGEVFSTLDDPWKWGTALLTGEGVLDQQTQQLRRDSLVTDVPPMTATAAYGIGDRDGWWGHDGDIPGYTVVAATHLRHRHHDHCADQQRHRNGQRGKTAPATAVLAALQQALQ